MTGVVQPRVATNILGCDETWGWAKPGSRQGFPSCCDRVFSRLVMCRDLAIVSQQSDETGAHLRVRQAARTTDTRARARATDGLSHDREFSVATEISLSR